MADEDHRAVKAPRDQRPDTCLHCTLMTAIEEHFERFGKRDGHAVVIDVLDAIAKLSECAVELINFSPDRSQRRRAIRFAHEALDANVQSQQTGKLVPVEVPPEH